MNDKTKARSWLAGGLLMAAVMLSALVTTKKDVARLEKEFASGLDAHSEIESLSARVQRLSDEIATLMDVSLKNAEIEQGFRQRRLELAEEEGEWVMEITEKIARAERILLMHDRELNLIKSKAATQNKTAFREALKKGGEASE